MTANIDTALQRVEAELERIGLLLEHDRDLPSVTTLVAGEPIKGSWWGHPLGHTIYELSGKLSAGSGALDAKLVNGKVTYIHPRLWPAFLTLAQDVDASRTRELSPLARKLFARIAKSGPQRLDLLARDAFAERKALTAASRELELALLVHVESIHTDSGAHAKQLQDWGTWSAAHVPRGVKIAADVARADLATALAALCRATTRTAKVPPWYAMGLGA